MTHYAIIGKERLRQISGARQRGKITDWLSKTGIPFMLDANGWPVVSEAAVSAKLGAPVKIEPRINFA